MLLVKIALARSLLLNTVDFLNEHLRESSRRANLLRFNCILIYYVANYVAQSRKLIETLIYKLANTLTRTASLSVLGNIEA